MKKVISRLDRFSQGRPEALADPAWSSYSCHCLHQFFSPSIFLNEPSLPDPGSSTSLDRNRVSSPTSLYQFHGILHLGRYFHRTPWLLSYFLVFATSNIQEKLDRQIWTERDREPAWMQWRSALCIYSPARRFAGRLRWLSSRRFYSGSRAKRHWPARNLLFSWLKSAPPGWEVEIRASSWGLSSEPTRAVDWNESQGRARHRWGRE